MIWLKFASIQLVMLAATVIGWFLLLPFCVTHAWTIWDHQSTGSVPLKSSKDSSRTIDQWSAPLLRWLYNNPEDGVSGQTALVWNSTGTKQIPYAPTQFVWLNGYLWSAWRNSCDSLKYVFADPNAPLVTFRVLGRTAKIGWQGGLPVMSI